VVTDPIEVALGVISALDACAVRYTIGGSLASSFSGEPRASIDVDILVDMTSGQVEPFLRALGPDFYADPDALRRAIASHSTTNLVHRGSAIKVDLFMAGSLLDIQQLERRRRVQVAPDAFIYVHSPEDILLQKLHWFRLGGKVSDRQWRDALSIVLVQGARLDRGYLETMASRTGLTDLLERALREGAGA
jgi:hypothetical protein